MWSRNSHWRRNTSKHSYRLYCSETREENETRAKNMKKRKRPNVKCLDMFMRFQMSLHCSMSCSIFLHSFSSSSESWNDPESRWNISKSSVMERILKIDFSVCACFHLWWWKLHRQSTAYASMCERGKKLTFYDCEMCEKSFLTICEWVKLQKTFRLTFFRASRDKIQSSSKCFMA